MTVDESLARFDRHLVTVSTEPAVTAAPPAFGTVFTDHMVTVRYHEQKGWHDARVEPFGPIPMSPAAAVLHYGQEIFEGLKAYRSADGDCLLFRPEAHARRFQESARRLSMPVVPAGLFLRAIAELLEVDRGWLPGGVETSLYLRPYLVATEAFLGVRPAREYLFAVIATPVGPVSPGSKPLTVWASETYSRAGAGGTGAAKCGGNYAGAHLAQAEAARAGCDQVVFLDSGHHQFVEEMAGMNLFFGYEGHLVTPTLTGTILPGVTRDSIIWLARDAGLDVVERPIALAEWQADAASGKLREVFACGTAATVAQIGMLRTAAGDFPVTAPGPMGAALRGRLLGIQYGRLPDPCGWTRRIGQLAAT
ncbi:branched-chain amino acid aminotransferase [Micromonospora orduensis]|uniref:Branched-chain-amino-acid aminotransferase n=1 Tax=Micromonospora orduensis TaxID=1420891 RepID=A0A5C4QIE2_9ACTN|nr:branched-chain amino acid aminotransferase [Micromonospora orduensis]